MPDASAANAEAVRRLTAARPLWTRACPAGAAIPGLEGDTLLHAGPPLDGEPPPLLRRALAAALIFEGRARTLGEADALLPRFRLVPANDLGAVAPLAGVISPSMPVVVVEAGDTRAYAPLNEGGGCVIRFGCARPEAIAGLARLRDAVAPALDALLTAGPGIDVFELVALALHMGDDCHHRFRSMQLQLTVALCQRALQDELPSDQCRLAVEAVRQNDYFPLNVVMAAAKAAARSAEGVAGSSLLTAVARNGRETGVRVSGLPERWFVAPVEPVAGVALAAEGAAEAEPDTGDSCVVELNGLGACALQAAPSLTRWFGGTYGAITEIVEDMRRVALQEHPLFTIPALDYRGTPVGIDCRRAVDLNVAPATETLQVARDRHPHPVTLGLSRVPLAALAAAAEALEVEAAGH